MQGPDTLRSLFLRFLGFGLRAWGGPPAQIAMLREELVDREAWMGKHEFHRTLAVYQALPGPEATELCVHFGMLRRGRLGALAAGLGFLLPGLLLMLALAWAYTTFGLDAQVLAALVVGVQPAVAALVLRATVRLGQHALHDRFLLFVGAGAGLAVLLGASFWFILPAAGLACLAWSLRWRGLAVAFVAAALALAALFAPAVTDAAPLQDGVPGAATLAELGWSGLKAGLLTFGGAYTAIPFLQEDAVGPDGWVTGQQFIDGIALAGLLPAPLVIFATFLGHLGGGLPGALLMTLGIFAPAFAFTLLGYPLFARLVNQPRLHAFLDGVTAAAIGLIAVTALGMLLHALQDVLAATVFAFAVTALWSLTGRFAVPLVLATSGVAGWVLTRLAA